MVTFTYDEIKARHHFYVALMFDDGYLSQYNIAKYLARIGIRATFFITTHIREQPWLASSPEMIVDISNFGHEIGSHTCTHPNLLLLSRDELEHEIKESKKYLEHLLEREVHAFAYPFMLCNKEIIRVVHKYYKISRGGEYLYIGSRKINAYRVSSSIESLLKKLLKNELKSFKIVIHNENPLRIKLLASLLKTCPFIRFVTISELASILVKSESTNNDH